MAAYASISTIIPFSAGKDEVYCIESSTRIVSYDIRTYRKKLITTIPQSLANINKLMIQFAVYDPGTNTVWMNRGDYVADSAGLIRVEVGTGKTEVISWPCFTGKKNDDYNGALCLDRKRNLIWINNGDGLLSMDLATKKISAVPYFLNLARKGYTNSFGINLDKKGQVWVASSSHGILVYDPEKNSCLPLFSDSIQQKESGDANFSIYFDKNDMAWLGYAVKKNIRQLIPYTSAVRTVSYNTFKSPVSYLFHGRNGNIILASGNGVMEWNPATGVIRNPGKLYSGLFMSLDTVNEKYWSIKTDHSRILETDLRSGKVTAIRWPEGNGSDPAASVNYNLVYPSRNGIIFMADGKGVYQVCTGDSVAKKIIPIDFHATNFVLANQDYIFIRLHFSSRNLCYRFNGKSWELFLNPIDKINWSCVLYDTVTSSYWVGALQELYHFDRDFHLIKKYSKTDGIEVLDVLSLMTDKMNNIWFNNSSGEIWKLETATGLFTKINEKDGYVNQEYDWQTPHLRGINGELFYKGHTGITIVYPEKIKGFTLPRIYISKIRVNHQPWNNRQPVAGTDEMILNYDQRSLTFQAGLIDYNTYKDSRIRYRMEGLNQDWHRIMPGEDIHYFELATGHYTLVLQAAGSGNNFTGPVRKISITIRPAFWQQTSFWLPVSILIFCFLYLLVRKRINEKYKTQIENSRREMQLAEMKQKTTELEQKALDMEMKTLRAQMNPHFIFNSLNSINMFILQNNKTSASSYLTKFSRLIRMILQHSQEQLISLESELEALALYLELRIGAI